jgi:hypothetical protein
MNKPFLQFDFSTQKLIQQGKSVESFELDTSTGQRVRFSSVGDTLVWDVPFLLLDNIFFKTSGAGIELFNDIDVTENASAHDWSSTAALRKNGYLPHLRTQFSNVYCVCSYLSYKISAKGIFVKPSSATQESPIESGLSPHDIYELWANIFRTQVEKANQDQWIIPLSGGMDSRMLLNEALKYRDVQIKLFTHGVPTSGDVQIARRIAREVGLEKNHVVFNLESLSRRDVLNNYRLSGYLLPLDRLLGIPIETHFQGGAILSGLYGDVIFADNVITSDSYSRFYEREGWSPNDDTDSQVISAYTQFSTIPKFQRVLLRAQKLTRLGLVYHRGFKVVAPFVDYQVISASSAYRGVGLYPRIVRRWMRPSLRRYMHQSSASWMTHPKILRKVTKGLLMVAQASVLTPYFTPKLLASLQIEPGEVPTPMEVL